MNALLAHGLTWASARRGKRLGTVGALACAFLLHMGLLLLMLSWRAPPAALALSGAGDSEVSLVLLTGRVAKAVKPPSRRPAEPKRERTIEAQNKVAAAQLVAIKPGSNIKMRPALNPPPDLEPIVVALSLGGGEPPSPEVLPAPSPAMQALAATQAGGKSCQIFEILQTMLKTSDEVGRALPLIPAQARSVANAVLLWDGRWVDASTVGGPASLGPIQSTVLLAVAAAPPTCQAELVRGPRLIAVGDTRDTTVLAFGSGEWRWGDILASPHPPQSVNLPLP
jgi:hypothetical protein